MNRSLPGRTSIHIVSRLVDKVGLGEQTFLPWCRCEWLGNVCANIVQLTCPYLRTAEVPPVGDNLQLRSAHCVLCSERHSAKLSVIVSDIGYLVFNDQVVSRIYRRLHVIAHYAGASSACRHGALHLVRYLEHLCFPSFGSSLYATCRKAKFQGKLISRSTSLFVGSTGCAKHAATASVSAFATKACGGHFLARSETVLAVNVISR